MKILNYILALVFGSMTGIGLADTYIKAIDGGWFYIWLFLLIVIFLIIFKKMFDIDN